MEWVETTGRTIAEAKERALDQLGVDNSDAEFEIVSEPKTGLFGRLKTEARVRARVAPSAPRSKDQGPRKRRGGRVGGEKHGDSQRKPASSTKGTGQKSDKVGTQRSRPVKAKPAAPKAKKPAASSETQRGEQVSETQEQVPLAEQGAVAEDFLRGFFDASSSTASISRSEDEEEQIVRIAVDGSNLGHLIGPRGSTLHSLQEITRTVVQRQTGSRSGRIVLDVGGYREKRKAALEEFTKKVAEEVKASGEQRTLEPMNPADRKIVHDTINDIDGVETTSEGEEPRRYVVLNPAN